MASVFIYTAVCYCLRFLIVRGTWLIQIQCVTKILLQFQHAITKYCHSQTIILSMRERERGTLLPLGLRIHIIMFDVRDTFVCIQSNEMNNISSPHNLANLSASILLRLQVCCCTENEESNAGLLLPLQAHTVRQHGLGPRLVRPEFGAGKVLYPQ